MPALELDCWIDKDAGQVSIKIVGGNEEKIPERLMWLRNTYLLPLILDVTGMWGKEDYPERFAKREAA